MLASQSEPTSLNLVFRASLIRVQKGLKVGFTDQKLSLPKELPSKAAMALAMGYRFLQAVELGEVQDFAALAKKLRVSRAWVSMSVELTFLAPRIQNAILVGVPTAQTIQELGRIARLREWSSQLSNWDEIQQGSNKAK